MTKERVLKVLDQYYNLVTKKFEVEPARTHPNWYGLPCKEMLKRQQAQHISWMCLEAQKFLESGRTEKAMRWLGFIQAWLWTTNLKVLNDLKKDSKG